MLTYTPNCPQTSISITETEYFLYHNIEETLFDEQIKNWKNCMAELQPVMAAIEVLYKHSKNIKRLPRQIINYPKCIYCKK